MKAIFFVKVPSPALNETLGIRVPTMSHLVTVHGAILYQMPFFVFICLVFPRSIQGFLLCEMHETLRRTILLFSLLNLNHIFFTSSLKAILTTTSNQVVFPPLRFQPFCTPLKAALRVKTPQISLIYPRCTFPTSNRRVWHRLRGRGGYIPCLFLCVRCKKTLSQIQCTGALPPGRIGHTVTAWRMANLAAKNIQYVT